MTTKVANIERISVSATAAEGDGDSVAPVFSPLGTQVLFASTADNLVSDDANAHQDVFVVTLSEDGIVGGTTGADHLNGRDTAETFKGREGNDVIHTNGGDDILYGDAGNDALYGGDGDDTGQESFA